MSFNWIKKTYLWVYTFFHHLFQGLENANSVAFETGDSSNDSGGGIEVKKHRKSVLQDLLRGELTEEVKELRYEMYLAEQKSHDYKYLGNGRARKYVQEEKDAVKDAILCPYDGYSPLVVVSNFSIDNYSDDNMVVRINRDGFVPRFRLEQFTEKVYVYENGNKDNFKIDLFVNSYDDRVYRVMKMFFNEIESIIAGKRNSDVVDIESLSFDTKKLVTYTFSDIKFEKIEKIRGYYIISFNAGELQLEDLPTKFYHEETHKKIEANAPRNNGASLDFYRAVKEVNEESEVTPEIMELFEEFKKNQA